MSSAGVLHPQSKLYERNNHRKQLVINVGDREEETKRPQMMLLSGNACAGSLWVWEWKNKSKHLPVLWCNILRFKSNDIRVNNCYFLLREEYRNHTVLLNEKTFAAGKMLHWTHLSRVSHRKNIQRNPSCNGPLTSGRNLHKVFDSQGISLKAKRNRWVMRCGHIHSLTLFKPITWTQVTWVFLPTAIMNFKTPLIQDTIWKVSPMS